MTIVTNLHYVDHTLCVQSNIDVYPYIIITLLPVTLFSMNYDEKSQSRVLSYNQSSHTNGKIRSRTFQPHFFFLIQRQKFEVILI